VDDLVTLRALELGDDGLVEYKVLQFHSATFDDIGDSARHPIGPSAQQKPRRPVRAAAALSL
jgi:hypothetical protein